MMTRRESIAKLLEESEVPLTAQDICLALDIKKRSIVEEDIGHIAQSVKRRGKVLQMTPASCAKCGFVFKSRVKAKSPSKCPKCRSEWIIKAQYLIRDK